MSNPEHTVEQTTGPFSIVTQSSTAGPCPSWPYSTSTAGARYETEHRRSALALVPMLTETGRVERETGETYFDEDTGRTVPVVVTVFEGPCLVRPQFRITEEQAGGTTYVVGEYDATLPADATVERNDILKITEAPFAATLEGAALTLLDVPLDSWQVARFCTAERYT